MVSNIYSYTQEGAGHLLCLRQQLPTGSTGMFCCQTDLKLVRIVSGQAQWQIGTSEYEVFPGDIVVLSNSEPRCFTHIPVPILLEHIVFSPALVHPILRTVRVFFQRPIHVSPILAPDMEGYTAVNNAFSAVIREAESTATYRDETVYARLLKLLCELARIRDTESASLPEEGFELLSEAVAYIHRHYAESVSESLLARRLGTTPERLSH